MSLKNWGFVLVMFGLGFAGGDASADITARAAQIVVVGNGSASAAPDQATVRLGARETAKTAQEALAASSRATAAILSRLAEAGIDPADIQTSSISLGPIWRDYQEREAGAQLPPIGFEASNQIVATLRDLERLGVILDAVAQDGANSFSGFSLGLQNPEPVEDAARRDAVADARRKALLYAQAAGVGLGEIILITEDLDSGGGYPAPMMEMSASRSVPVPVAQGEVTLSASVRVVYKIAP